MPHSKSLLSKLGFTRFELLAIIAIMVVMITMGAMGIRNFTTRKNTSTSLPSVEAVFAQARATAIGHGVKTRVMTDCIDHKDSAYCKRCIMNAVLATDKNGKVDADK